MNSINCFLNTEIRNSGILAAVGDFCLRPLRYFRHGKTVWLRNIGPAIVNIQHVTSYHKDSGHRSRLLTYQDNQTHQFSSQYTSRQKHWLITVGAIVTLVPGFFLGVLLKGLAYYSSSSMRERHEIVTRYFNPTNKEIGKYNQLNQAQLDWELEHLIRVPNNKIDAFIIHGENSLTIEQTDDRIQALNPQKIILVGPKGISKHDPSMSDDYAKLIDCYYPPVKQVNDIDEALAHQRETKAWFRGGKPYKTMYEVNA